MNSKQKSEETNSKNNRVGTTSNKYDEVRKEVSAGGIVIKNIDKPRKQQEVALIGKLDRKSRMVWTFPKGHIEKGETLEDTALREIKEETGLSGRIVTKLGMIKYFFVFDNIKINKDVHHFLVKYTGGSLCDEDPEVTEVIWIPITEAYDKLVFSDEAKLLRQAEKMILHKRRIKEPNSDKSSRNSLAQSAFNARQHKRKNKK